LEILKREVDWKSPLNRETRNDCMLHCLGNYSALKLTGLTQDGFFMANLVRLGLLTREEAMVKEEATKKDLKRECQEALKAMGLSKDIVSKILSSQEFVNNRRKLLLRLRRDFGLVRRLLA